MAKSEGRDRRQFSSIVVVRRRCSRGGRTPPAVFGQLWEVLARVEEVLVRIEPTTRLSSFSSTRSGSRVVDGNHLLRITGRSQNLVSASSLFAMARDLRKSLTLIASSASAMFAPTDEPAAASCFTILANRPSARSRSATARDRSANDSVRSKNSGFNRPRPIALLPSLKPEQPTASLLSLAPIWPFVLWPFPQWCAHSTFERSIPSLCMSYNGLRVRSFLTFATIFSAA